MNNTNYMDFFVPAADNLDQALDVLNAVYEFLKMQGYKPLRQPIYSLDYIHNGMNHIATVNEISSVNKERVLLILPSEDDLYFVCTPNRAVIRGEPILIGKHEVKKVEYFQKIS